MGNKILNVKNAQKLLKSIWVFPIILTIFLILFTSLKINGSSLGIYQSFFYGTRPDPNLIVNKPEAIRSDEWVTNTQMAVAQSNDGYNEINKNLGNGADMSVIVDAPYYGISELFKAHNLSFFVLPFDNAFAFKWWVMGYLLILSVYFFVLTLLPKRKTIAILLSLAMFFAPFIQWWYQYITLAPIYYVLFAGTITIHLIRAGSTKKKVVLSVLLAYTLISFALVQYPPFQIPCIIAMTVFVLGYLIEQRIKSKKGFWKSFLPYIVAACVVAAASVGLFLYDKHSIITTVNNTAYPGKRIIKSGGYSFTHLFSNNLSYQFQNPVNASTYSVPAAGATNQSESSNFILLLPFLLLPSVLVLYRLRKQKKIIDYPLLLTLAGFIFLIAWLFVPHLDVIGKITLLSKVPLDRLMIGFGLLNLMVIILFIRSYERITTLRISTNLVYSLGVFIFLLFVGWRVHIHFPEFVGVKTLIALSIPIPVVIYLLLRKHFKLGLLVFSIFSIISTVSIHPLYHGTGLLTDNNLVKTIATTPTSPGKKWVMEDALLQSFAFMAGKPSLTGIYEYPQLDLWKDVVSPDQSYTYNRYAHVNFNFNRDPTKHPATVFSTSIPDHFAISTEACSPFIAKLKVEYIVTSGLFTKDTAPCATLVDEVPYPTATFHIYKLSF